MTALTNLCFFRCCRDGSSAPGLLRRSNMGAVADFSIGDGGVSLSNSCPQQFRHAQMCLACQQRDHRMFNRAARARSRVALAVRMNGQQHGMVAPAPSAVKHTGDNVCQRAKHVLSRSERATR
jgi:hypothetical protein